MLLHVFELLDLTNRQSCSTETALTLATLNFRQTKTEKCSGKRLFSRKVHSINHLTKYLPRPHTTFQTDEHNKQVSLWQNQKGFLKT